MQLKNIKNIPNKYLFILALMFLCQGVIVFTNWLIYYPDGNEENIHWYQIIGYFILTMLPAVALANIYLLSTFCKNKLGKIAINIITTIIAIIIYIFSIMLQIACMPAYRAPKYKAYPIEKYTHFLKAYNKDPKATYIYDDIYGKYKVSTYFPDEIPENVKNYCCFSYEGFTFLRFNTDNKYLNDTITNTKDIVEKTMKLQEFQKDYPDVYLIFKPYMSIKDADKYKVHLFKQSIYENFDYYGGFITLKETGEIIFFSLDLNTYNNDNRWVKSIKKLEKKI